MKKIYLISIILSIGCFALGIMFARGSYLFFVDSASFLLLFFPSIFMMLVNFSPGEIFRAFSIAWERSIATKQEYKQALLVFKAMQQYFFTSTVIAFFMGIILMLSDISDPRVFGRGMAITLLVVLYTGIVVLILTTPFKNALKKKLIMSENEK